jgi:PKD repeat protein
LGSYVDFFAEGDGEFTWNSNSELLGGGQVGDSTARYTVGSQVLGSVYTTMDYGTKECASSVGFNAYGYFVPTVSIAANEAACVGDEVEFLANITSYGIDTSVEWIIDGTPADTVWAPSASASTSTGFTWEGESLPGVHTIEAAVIFDPYPLWLPDYGCADTVAHVVEVVSLPSIESPNIWTGCNQAIAEDFPPVIPAGGWWTTPDGTALNEWVPGAFGLGTHEVVYTYEDAYGCQASDSILFQVEAPIWAEAGADTLTCESSELAVLPTAEEGGYWTGPGITDAGMGVVDLSELSPGSYGLVYNVGSGSCATSDTMVWEVLENPSVFLSTEGSLACDGDTVWLEVFAGGGEVAGGSDYQFEWSNQVGFGPNGAPFVLADAASPFDAVELVVIDDLGCQDEAIAFVTPVSLPDATAPLLDPTCNQDFPLFLPLGDGEMGNWSGPGVNEETNAFNPAAVGEGQVNLVYTVTGPLGCMNSDTTSMNVLAPPVVSAGPSLSVCANSLPIELAGFEPAMGSWEGAVQTASGTWVFDPIASGIGTHVLTYAVGEASCAVSDSMTVAVTSLPELAMSEAQALCAGDTAFGEVAIEGAVNLESYSFVWEASELLDTNNPWEFSAGPWVTPGLFTATVAVSDSLGCEASAELQWEVLALPTIDLPSVWALCANEGTVELPVATPEGGSWSGTGVEWGVFNAEAAAEGVFALTYAVVDESGCTNEAVMQTEVVEPLDFDLGPKVHACEDQGLAYLPTPEELIGFWSGPALSDEDSNAVDLSLISSDTFVYVYTHTGEVCTVESEVELEVHPKPELTVSSSGEVCPDSILVLAVDVDLATLPLAFEWTLDEALVPGDTGELNVMWPAPGEHSVSVAVSDDWGCFASMNWTVEALELAPVEVAAFMAVCNQAVPVDLSSFAQALNAGTQTFTGIGGAEFAIDTLDFLHPEVLDPGAYEVVYEFVPEVGCPSRDTMDLMVEVPFQVQAGSDTATCVSNPTLELAAENGSTSVSWSLVGGSSSAFLNSAAGLVDVQALGIGMHHVVVSAGEGTCATSDTLLLEVVPTPVLDFSTTASSACVGSEMFLNVQAVGADGVTWNWNGQMVAFDSLLFEAEEAGPTEFEVVASDAQSGCESSAPWVVTVHAAPAVEVFADADAGCSPLTVSFFANASEGLSQWDWQLNGDSWGAEEVFDAVLETVDTVSTAVVSVTVLDDNGCVGQASADIEVWPEPNAGISLQEEVLCGIPAEVQALADSNAGNEVHWNVNGELVATGNVASLPIVSLGWHAVEAVLTNAWGCTQVAVDSIEVLPLPSAALSAEPMMGCGPLEVLLNVASGEAEPTLSLLHEGSTSMLPALDSILVLNQPGAYQLMLHVVDDRGCENTVELADSITVFPTPFVDFAANPYAGTFENPDPLNSTWSFENLSDAGEALWDFGDGTLSTIWNGAHTYDQPGTYAVNVMVVNAFGCAGEATREIEVEENLQVFVPNAFTPPTNGYSDGVNDGWRPEISAPELVDSYWLRVFNRYGQLVWESHDPEEYWIGQAGQESAFFGMNDAYTWILRVESRAQRPAQREWRGHVTLIR